MANHKSALKKVRSDRAKRLRNKYQLTTARTFEKKLRKLTDKAEATNMLKTIYSLFDKLAKKNIIHKNKAANHKSHLTKMVAKMA